jgi:spermidine synthase
VRPTTLVGKAPIPGHAGELRCFHHDGDYTIRVDGIELMSTRVHGSEEQLTELALQRLGPRAAAHLLVGGLGMGFTLARALALASPDATITVAELVPEVVTWNRELFGGKTNHPLRDPRTRLVVGDVGQTLAAHRDAFDAILLDVDNGPDSLVRPANDSLYSERGIAIARAALRTKGVLAVWSAAPAPAFAARLRRASFDVVEHRVRARRTKGPRRTIWIAERRGPAT